MDAEVESLMQQIKEANPSWQAWARSQLHSFQYDADADILYMTYGKSTEAFSVPIGDPDEGANLRVELETYRVIGIDIIGLRTLFLPKHPDAGQAFEPLFEVLGNDDWRIEVRPPSGNEKGSIALYRPAIQASSEFFRAYLRQIVPELVPA